MEIAGFEAFISRGAEELGIALPSEASVSFRKYYDFLEEKGRSFNLTAITGPFEVARLHFLDSLALLNAAQFKNKRVIDVGSGAGFPGVPIKIAEQSVDLTLLDATGKRVDFLSELCSSLNLDAVCVLARAEDKAHEADMREKYDIAVSRAVARLNVLCELCLPFVRVGGIFIAMKGVDSPDEIEEARGAIATLGADHTDFFDYCLPGADITHRAVLINKTSETPDKYPRRFPKIKKAPL